MQFMKHDIQQELNAGREICIVCIFFRHMASSVDTWNENHTCLCIFCDHSGIKHGTAVHDFVWQIKCGCML